MCSGDCSIIGGTIGLSLWSCVTDGGLSGIGEVTFLYSLQIGPDGEPGFHRPLLIKTLRLTDRSRCIFSLNNA